MSEENSVDLSQGEVEPVGSPVHTEEAEGQQQEEEPSQEPISETNDDADNTINNDHQGEDEVDPSAEDDKDEAKSVQSENEEVGDTADYQDLTKLKARKRSSVPPLDSTESQSPRNRTVDTAANAAADDYDYDQGLGEGPAYSHQETDAATKRRQELEARLDRALKKPKMKKRKGEEDLTNDEDELIQILKNQMDIAAKKDAELIENQSGIAVNKIQLLPKVRDILSKANLAEVILDNNLLAEVRQWLEPLPDASLPSYEIQKTLFGALLKLPINTNHLRESGIGKILLFYQKSKRVEPKIKRVADKLISDWTRPIIGASDNYRDKQFHSIDYDALKHRKKLKATAEKIHIDNSEKTIYEQQAARRNRAAAPVPTVTDYKFAPKSRLDRTPQSIVNAGVGTSLNRDDQFKRINQRLSGRKTASKKGGVSIEGRGVGL